MADAHLNGSLNLASAEDVFRTVARIADGSIKKVPDGETGERLGWIDFFGPRMDQSDDLARVAIEIPGYHPQPRFRLREGLSYEDFVFPELGYAAAARASYSTFQRLRDGGVIADDVRFQVSLATVIAGVLPFIAPDEQHAAMPAFTRRLRRELDEILDAVPAEDLALQWDVAVEMAIVEGIIPIGLDAGAVIRQLCELSSWVPAEVPLGYHLCYGDAREEGEREGRHFRQPKDTANLVMVANGVTEGAARPLHWFSMPVPVDRDDDAYVEPLADLRLDTSARLYLGLVHHQDGVAGTQRRIDTAKRHYSDFGVATECGMGRKPRELVYELLEIQAEVTV